MAAETKRKYRIRTLPLCRSPEESRDISNVRVKRERYEMADGWLAF
jgi:hypothetical protein